MEILLKDAWVKDVNDAYVTEDFELCYVHFDDAIRGLKQQYAKGVHFSFMKTIFECYFVEVVNSKPNFSNSVFIMDWFRYKSDKSKAKE